MLYRASVRAARSQLSASHAAFGSFAERFACPLRAALDFEVGELVAQLGVLVCERVDRAGQAVALLTDRGRVAELAGERRALVSVRSSWSSVLASAEVSRVRSTRCGSGLRAKRRSREIGSRSSSPRSRSRRSVSALARASSAASFSSLGGGQRRELRA